MAYTPGLASLSAFAQTILDDADAATARATLSAVGKGELVINAADAAYGAVPNTGTNQSTQLQAAADATPDGGTLRIPPGRYSCIGLTVTGKSINIEGYGAVLEQRSAGNVLTVTGAYETIYNVSSITEDVVLVDVEASDGLGMTLTLNAAPGWSRGDIVKLIADDEIPGQRYDADASNRSRVGQFHQVYSVSGTSVKVKGALRDPFTTNIRIARMVRHTASVVGLRIESSDPVTFTGAGAIFRYLYRPRINMSFGPMASVICTFGSCYAPQANVIADEARNDPNNSHVGYALLDSGSEYGTFSVTAGDVRHAYTDDSARFATASATVGNYGRSYGHVVTGVAHRTSNSAWNTHSSAMNITFVNCVAIDCNRAFGLRGIGNTILNGVSYGSRAGALAVYNEPANGAGSRSYGHTVDGLVVKNHVPVTGSPAISVLVNDSGSEAGVRETGGRLYFRNIVLEGVAEVAEVYNHTAIFENIRVVAAATLPDDTTAIYVDNSEVRLDNIELDYRGNTSGTGLVGVAAEGTGAASAISGRRFYWRYNTGDVARFYKVLNDTATNPAVWDMESVEVDFPPGSTAIGVTTEGARIDYRAKSNGTRTGFFHATGTAISTVANLVGLCRSADPVLILRCNPSGAHHTVAKLSPGKFLGQMLTIWNAGSGTTFTATIGHGNASYLTDNIGDADVVLLPGETATWTWGGVDWLQTSVPVVPSSVSDQGLVSSIPRISVNLNNLSTATGNLRLSYFTAPWSGAFTKIRAWCGNTAAAATPTLIRYGVYSVAADGDLTLIGSTANDTTLFAVTSTAYEKALSATVNLAYGQRYAYGLLIVTGVAAPTASGVAVFMSSEAALEPRLNGLVGSQTDLPSTITAGSVSASTTNLYMALVP